MSLAVHFVARNTRIEMIGVDPLQLPGLSGAGGTRRRVVELWDPSVEVRVADIVMNDREIPEALSLMYEADEVHIHGIIPRVALKMVPQSKLELLDETVLVVHGPWSESTELINNLGGEQELVWPGPVRFDESARACWNRDMDDGLEGRDATGKKAMESEDLPRRFFFDMHRGALVPYVGPRIPEEEGGVRRVSIFVASEYGDSARESIVAELEKCATEDVNVEVCHDQSASKLGALRTSRTAHLCIVPLMGYWSTSLSAMGAIAQEVPLAVVGEDWDIEQPPGVRAVDDFESLGPLLAECFARWRVGEAAPLDPVAARAWLLERVEG